MELESLLEANSNTLTLSEIEKFPFSIADVFWKKRKAKVRLLAKGDIVDVEKLKKYKAHLSIEDPISFSLNHIKENFNELKKIKSEKERTHLQDRILFSFRQNLWDGEFNISSLDLLNLYASEFETKDYSHICEDFFKLTALRASLSCTLLCLLGYTHYQFLKDVYLSHFLYFSAALDDYQFQVKNLVTFKDVDAKALNLLFLNSYNQVKDEKLNYPVVLEAFKNICPKLFVDKQTPWQNFTELEQVLFFTHHIFMHGKGDLECVEKIFGDGKCIFENANMNAFFKTVMKEYKNCHEKTPPFFEALSKQMDGRFLMDTGS